jgi:C4-dicarboxylate-specific signal transduction histidine kinase
MPKASLSQVIDNVVVNAIYWLNGKSETNQRNLSIAVNKNERSIVICNDGPKIQPNIRRALFRSYFVTSKPNGRGLGMYISHQIMKRNNGTIELLDENSSENKYGGAAFKIGFE